MLARILLSSSHLGGPCGPSLNTVGSRVCVHLSWVASQQKLKRISENNGIPEAWKGQRSRDPALFLVGSAVTTFLNLNPEPEA